MGVRISPDVADDRLEQPPRNGMLDDPAHSRQWVARRLQRALSMERWGAPLRTGLAHGKDGPHRILAAHAAAAEERIRRLVDLIRLLGSEPYATLGGTPFARTAGNALAVVSRSLADRAADWLATHTLGEYEALEAFVDAAPGIPSDIVNAIAPLHQEVVDEAKSLRIIGARRT